MKRILALLLSAMLCAVNAAWAEEAPSQTVLIAYFSLEENAAYADDVDASASASIVATDEGRVGTTEYIARLIQNHTGGDIHSIQTEESYPADFDAVVDQNHQERDAGTMPALSSRVENMDGYDVVFLGYPVWAGSAPRAILSFLSDYAFAGKTIVPFCIHDGYGAGGSFSAIQSAAPEAEVLEGFAIPAGEIEQAGAQVTAWLESLGMPAAAETPIVISFAGIELSAVLYDTPEARQFLEMLPMTVAMRQFGGREFYGGISGDIAPESEGQLYFADGDITYCDQNNTVAIFYAQTDRPDLTMRIVSMGRVTGGLSALAGHEGGAEMTFALAE